MTSTRKKLDRMAEIERRNDQRIGAFTFDDAERERRRSRLAWIEGYTTAKPGMEKIRERIIARYRHELEIDQ